MTLHAARRRLIRAGLACAALPLARPGAAQPAWPQRPIRMIIGFAPGGPTDIVARVVAARLSEQIGQQVVVDNKPGAGGNIAADLAAKAAPDGHTIFYNTSAITIAPALYGKVPFDPLRDFVPVSTTATNAMIVMVNPSVPARTIGELVAFAKANPGRLNYGSSGTGTITHLATAALASQLGLQMTHVPYKGSAPSLVDTAAGVVQLMTDTVNSALPYVKDGRLRALAVTMPRRLAVLPEVPTLSETVMAGMEMSAWQGVVVPAGTPAPIVQRLNGELRRVLAHEETRQKLIAQGTEILGSTPEEYAAYLRSELARWSKVVQETGAKAE
ncbi:MAG TPA: tripartite tricarboxylate transporter substrate binding protein [Burkholderiaceae bacterium]|nr:tripartite tricarboxylate transporter substrate binding protein [Burkholderiaceae bacterium]